MKIIVADEIKYALKNENNNDIYWITSDNSVFEWAVLLIVGGIFSVIFSLLSFGTGTLFVISVVASNLISFIEVAKQFYKADNQAKLNALTFSESLINAINKFNQMLNQDKKIKTLFKHKQNLKLNLYIEGGSGLIGGRYKTWIKFGNGQQESFVNFNPFRMIALLQLVKDDSNKDTIDALVPVLMLYDTSIKRHGYYKVNNVWYDFENYAPVVYFEIELNNFIFLDTLYSFSVGNTSFKRNYKDLFFLKDEEFSRFQKRSDIHFKNWVIKLANSLNFIFNNIQSTEKNYYSFNNFNDNQECLNFVNLINNKMFRFHFINSFDSYGLEIISTNLTKIDNSKPIEMYKYKLVASLSLSSLTENFEFNAYTFENVKLKIVFRGKLPAMNIFDFLTILNNYKQVLFRQSFFYTGSDGYAYLSKSKNFHNDLFDPNDYIAIVNYIMPLQVYTPDEIPELDLDYEIIKNENNYTLKIDKITVLPIRVEIYDGNGFNIHSQLLNEDLFINLNYNENYKIQYYLVEGTYGPYRFIRIGNLYEKIINIPKQTNQDNNKPHIPYEIKPIEKPVKDYKPSNLAFDNKIILLIMLLVAGYLVFRNKNEI